MVCLFTNPWGFFKEVVDGEKIGAPRGIRMVGITTSFISSRRETIDS